MGILSIADMQIDKPFAARALFSKCSVQGRRDLARIGRRVAVRTWAGLAPSVPTRGPAVWDNVKVLHESPSILRASHS